MAFKKYAVEDNCSAKLATAIDKTSTKIRLKEAVNLPTEGEWIATLIKKQGEVVLKMEKVLVLKRELDVLTVQRGFQSKSQEWEENDQLNLYITAEIVRSIQNAIDGKADLINGKVPASQLPEVSQIDESNLVHRSGDEEITGNKTFTGEIKVQSDLVLAPNMDFNNSSFSFGKRGDPTNIRGIERWAQANGKDASIYFTDYFSSTPTRLEHRCKQLWGYIKVGNQTRTFDRFQVRGYEGFDGTEASLTNTKKFIRLDAPKIYLHDGTDILGEWQQRTPTNGASTITSHHCRYKKIGKTCHFIAQVYVNNVAGNTPGFTLPIPRANYGTEFVVAGYCVKRGENPATQSRGAISFSGRDRFSTLVNTDVWMFDQPGEYIIRASGTYETE